MINIRVKHLTSLSDKSTGLIGAKVAYPIMFQTRFGIHTFGMRFPIDVLILNKENRVVKISKRLKPNKIFFWSPKFDTVIELPEGEIEKNKIGLGDTINMNFD